MASAFGERFDGVFDLSRERRAPFVHPPLEVGPPVVEAVEERTLIQLRRALEVARGDRGRESWTSLKRVRIQWKHGGGLPAVEVVAKVAAKAVQQLRECVSRTLFVVVRARMTMRSRLMPLD